MFDTASFAYHKKEGRRIIREKLEKKSDSELKKIAYSPLKFIFAPNKFFIAGEILSERIWPYNQW